MNDALTMREFALAHGYPAGSMRILTDQPGSEPPTRANILAAFRWLVSGARPGDRHFLHYSGHGSRERDTTGDEADGFDETIVPLDALSAGQITDDLIFDELVKPLPSGSRLFCIFDCCHSGTVMDLPYTWVFDGDVRPTSSLPEKEEKKRRKEEKKRRKKGWDGGGGWGGGEASRELVCTSSTAVAGEVIMLSGCGDAQTSADIPNVAALSQGRFRPGPPGAGGACTSAFVAAFDRGDNSYTSILRRMRDELKARNFAQIPQLSCSHNMDLAREQLAL